MVEAEAGAGEAAGELSAELIGRRVHLFDNAAPNLLVHELSFGASKAMRLT